MLMERSTNYILGSGLPSQQFLRFMRKLSPIILCYEVVGKVCECKHAKAVGMVQTVSAATTKYMAIEHAYFLLCNL